MEIVDADSAVLSNFEVLSYLREEKNERSQKQNKNKDRLLTLILEAIKHIENTPTSLQEEVHVKNFVETLQNLCTEENILLSKNEFIQLLNLRPKSAVEIQLIIDNSEERLTEDQVDKILDIVSTLPGDEEALEDAEQEVGDEEDGEDEGQQETDAEVAR